MTDKKVVKDMKFEEALAELEKHVEMLESGGLTLDESVEAFKYGIELSKICADKLNTARQEVEKIVTVTSNDYKLEPFQDLED
ncbi:MAG: exodeoxyribonuclease VII small subunit [Phascolarctobacterium sp.]|nr:exodeoxyribonuclease VII small subunit [Phascolarctobacterium sp.]